MKRLIFISTLIIIALIFGDLRLPKSREMTELSIIRMISIDKNAEGDMEICLAVNDVNEEFSSNSGGAKEDESETSSGKPYKPNQKNTKIISAKAKTLALANTELQKMVQKKIFWGQVEFCFIGEEAAREGISKYIDYFLRSLNFNLAVPFFLVKGDIKEFMAKQSESEYFLFDYIKIQSGIEKNNSKTMYVSIFDTVEELSLKNVSMAIPLIEIKTDMPSFELNGYGVFDNEKLVTFIQDDAAKGVNILRNKIKSDVIDVRTEDGESAALSIINCKSKIKPVFTGDYLDKIIVDINCKANLIESHYEDNGQINNSLNELNEKLSVKLKNYVGGALEISRQNRLDVADFSGKINIKNPIYYNRVKNEIKDILTNTEVEINVKTEIIRVYDSQS